MIIFVQCKDYWIKKQQRKKNGRLVHYDTNTINYDKIGYIKLSEIYEHNSSHSFGKNKIERVLNIS